MDRMVGKGLLTAEKIRNLTTLLPLRRHPDQARRGELAYALQHAFDGAMAPMFQCLLDTHKLGAEELSELEELIKARKRAAKK